MTVNAAEYKSRIGLDSLYVAVLTEDCSSAYTAGANAYLAPAAEASAEPTTNSESQYADDTVFDVMTAEGETKVTLSVTNYDPKTLATLLGKVFDASTGRMFDNNATPPYCALAFRSMKSNGSYRYYQYLKGRFESPSEEFATKGETPEPKPVELVFTAIYTIYKWTIGAVTAGFKRVVGDDDTSSFSSTGFFTLVQVPAVASPSALALGSSDPADAEAAVAVNKTIDLTFNNALEANAIYNVVVSTAAGALKACTNVLDATSKIMSINPNTDLAGATTYLVTYAVRDIYGQTLLGVIDFATA